MELRSSIKFGGSHLLPLGHLTVLQVYFACQLWFDSSYCNHLRHSDVSVSLNHTANSRWCYRLRMEPGKLLPPEDAASVVTGLTPRAREDARVSAFTVFEKPFRKVLCKGGIGAVEG